MNTEADKIQATRKTRVTHGDVEYSGIPVESCNSCHNRGKRIGVTYQGLMEFPYGSPYSAKGDKQPKLHTKKYLFISDDLHHQIDSRPENPKGGLLCQDCHTTVDMHGDGNIFGTTLAQVETECQDCHGTTDKFPWELPLGYSEEFSARHKQGLLVAMHRNKVSDAYVVFLFDDYAAVKALLQSVMQTLVYQPDDPSEELHTGPGISGYPAPLHNLYAFLNGSLISLARIRSSSQCNNM